MQDHTRRQILVAEDEPEVREYLDIALRCRGFDVQHAESGDEVLACLRSKSGQNISLVLLDLTLPQRDGIETLREIRRYEKNLPVVLLSGMTTPRVAEAAMQWGANAFLAKPFENSELLDAIRKSLQLREPLPVVKKPARPGQTRNAQFRNSWLGRMRSTLERIGSSDVPVLLNGETGSGKEVLARTLHALSPRASRPFLKLNCAALPSELVESELFGYEKGAFTGAVRSKPGKFDQADGGTILLDEIGDMDIRLQAKLLHVLQDQEFERLGGCETVRVDVRVMAATHSNLEQAMRQGRFREDLFYRLSVINLCVPPLRERKDEIPALSAQFVEKFSNSAPMEIPPVLLDAIMAYDWPGNVRELENFIRGFMVLQDADAATTELRRRRRGLMPVSSTPLDVSAAPQPGRSTVATLDLFSEAHRRAEVDAILAALERTRWNRKQAASLLRVDYKALLYKMKKFGIDQNPADCESEPERHAAAAEA